MNNNFDKINKMIKLIGTINLASDENTFIFSVFHKIFVYISLLIRKTCIRNAYSHQFY